jgi:hypothetical protein
MSLTHIDPMKHLVRETPVVKVFRRQLKFQDIITFWSIETGQWILAYWIDKKRKIVEEIDDLGVSFELVTPDLLRSITVCWRTVNWKAKKQRILSKEADRVRAQNDELIEDQSRWDWAKKRLSNRGRAPIPFAFGSPIEGGQVV